MSNCFYQFAPYKTFQKLYLFSQKQQKISLSRQTCTEVQKCINSAGDFCFRFVNWVATYRLVQYARKSLKKKARNNRETSHGAPDELWAIHFGNSWYPAGGCFEGWQNFVVHRTREEREKGNFEKSPPPQLYGECRVYKC